MADAWCAAQLFAIDPALAGGIALRASAGPVRERWLADLRAVLPASVPWKSVPLHIDDDRLIGGIDLAATLQRGRPVALRGLLAQAHDGVLVLAMAERLGEATVAHVAAALDRAVVVCARDGIDTCLPARFGVIALDEGAADDERASPVLLDRLAFHVDLSGIGWRDLEGLANPVAREELAAARSRLATMRIDDAFVEALCAAAVALGVASIRASLLAVRVARLSAAWHGRDAVASEDAALAARLVLGPRATQRPAHPEAAAEEAMDGSDANGLEEGADPPDPPPGEEPERTDEPGDRSAEPLDEVVLAAAAAAIPAGLLARLAALDAGPSTRGASGRAGALQASRRRGRPAGVRRERPRAGARLDVIATLRAAVPWQRLRGRLPRLADTGLPGPLLIRAEDFHVGRFKQRGRTTTIFAVDASGSAALHRLAEAKGAVELLLADCYVRRDSVAVLAFRGRSAELLLPPTRSLVRAKRCLAALPGGGGTPLAAGVAAAHELALAVRRRGDTPVIVVLSDGRANVARDGGPGRSRAEAESLLAARQISEDGLNALFIDTSAQPHPLARALAEAMRARYLPLPHAGAATLSAAVRAAGSEAAAGP